MTAVIAALAASLFLGGSVGLFVVRDRIGGGPSRVHLTALVQLGFPLAPAVAATWVGDFANRAILLGSAGAEPVAQLAVALRIASVAALAVAGFHLAWHPHAFAAGSSAAALSKLALDARRILVGVGGGVAIVALLAPQIVHVVAGPEYRDALPATGFSLVGALGGALYLVTSMPSALVRRMSHLAIASTAGVAISLAANAQLSGQFASTGTAAALALSPFVAALIAYFLGARHLRIPVPWVRVLVALLALAVITLVATVPRDGPSPEIRFLLGVVVVGVLAAEGTLGDVVKYVMARRRT